MLNIESRDFDWNVRPFRDIVTARLGRPCRSFDRWVQAPAGSHYWNSGIYGADGLTRARALPTLHIGGWWDCFRLGQMRDWAFSSTCGGGHQFLIVHATDHAGASEPWPTNSDGSLRDANQFMTDRASVTDRVLNETIDFYDWMHDFS